jgi:diguanylate cyclase (GGDEF)-like protein
MARLLIVEDELLIAQSLARKLGRLGYAITGIVTSGLDAIEAAATEKPDLVLMDIILQGDMDGIEAAEHIYAEYEIPVVFITAYADDDTLLEAQRVGAYGYLLKPYQEEAVNAALRIALTKHREVAKLHREASIDPLTGIFNRRQFLLHVDKEFHRWRRYGETFTLMLIDVDHFKAINDTWGHAAGDTMLTLVVECMRGALRLSDSLGRVGGDEFAVLLPNTGLDEANVLADRLCAGLAETEFTRGDRPPIPTLSIGITEARADDKTTEGIFERVDQNLYRAKRLGRGRVEAA